MRDPVRTPDPHLVADAASDQAVRLLFEGLYRPGPDGLPLPAGTPVELKPGGNHIMPMGLEAPIEPGDEVAVTLTLDETSLYTG